MLDETDIGHRVVVRRTAGGTPERPLFRDILGELLEITDQTLTVRTRAGAVAVPREKVHRAKRIPAPPRRDRDGG